MKINSFLLIGISLCLVQNVLGYEFRHIEREGEVLIESMLGRVMEIRCEEGIAHLIRSGHAASLKVEQVESRIFVTPFDLETAELIVLDRSGKSFRLKFMLGEKHEPGIILGTRKEQSINQKNSLNGLGVFFKGLIEERMPIGSIEQEPSKEVIKNHQTHWRVKKQYLLSSMMGYVFEVKNISQQGVFIAVEDIIFPGLLAVSVEQEVLHPKGKPNDTTRVFLIARQS